CGNRILKACANSLDPDETPQNVASHQDPNSLEAVADTITIPEGGTLRLPCILPPKADENIT
ncbi:hypothetical protein DPMN_185795, partial [Dreissena polymorpha]